MSPRRVGRGQRGRLAAVRQERAAGVLAGQAAAAVGAAHGEGAGQAVREL